MAWLVCHLGPPNGTPCEPCVQLEPDRERTARVEVFCNHEPTTKAKILMSTRLCVYKHAYLYSIVMVDRFKARLVGFENLISNLQTILVCIGLRFNPGYKNSGSLIAAATDVKSPLPIGVSLHVCFVDAAIAEFVAALLVVSTFLLHGSSQAMCLHQLVKSSRVAGFDVRIADGN